MIADDIGDFLAALVLEKGESENTRAAYAGDLARFAALLAKRGRTASGEVTREDIVAFLGEQRAAGRSSATRARRAAAIRTWLAYLKERRLIARNPTELMDAPQRERPLPRVLTEAEVAEMLDAVSGEDPRDRRDRAMLETLYGCGLRVSELCELEVSALVADGELLRVTGKGAKERVVPVGTAAGRALADYLASGRGAFAKGNLGETHVFLTRLGRPFTRQGVFKVIRERAAAVGIAPERISPHVLRHCFASHMLAHGADIRAIQEMLGHADIGTTQIYTHVDASRFGAIHRQYHPRA